ncbi:MAG: hypothetical protein IJ729_08015, partial [Alloprevotella sp.]|nr:hypothetical protein [Alloprevotella sp.]
RFFLVPANTFDNVKGDFPIGFQIWHTGINEEVKVVDTDVYDSQGAYIGKKTLYTYEKEHFIIDWLRQFYNRQGDHLAYMRFLGTDFQNNNGVFLTLSPSANDIAQVKGNWVTPKNIMPMCIYFAVRLCIESTWLNDRDQFLYPNNGWQTDTEFQTDCLVYTLFHGQNRIRSEHGTNYWIPFTESEINAQEKFESHFMSDFLHGKHKIITQEAKEKDLFTTNSLSTTSEEQHLQFSEEAKAVMDAGCNLWRYYHQQSIAKEQPDASFYDIRLYFQGTKTTRSGKVQMNIESKDAIYTALISDLRLKHKELAKRIEPKVYEYGFLKT